MSEFRRAGHEQVNVFSIDDFYLFKHYFDGEEVFARLKGYYNNQQYRFEVPSEEFEAIRSFLADHGYGLVVVDVIEAFVVVVKQYTAHPNNIFKASVIHRAADGYNCFLMTDQKAVEEAVQEGAIRLTNTDLRNPF
ncbi:hypothetical protein [Natronorarus salvus]|uniref:hypothetical protein n=1 Tax=Natronorarus salvus TaxID=3117733 RepID=UPI002F2602A4